MSGWIYRHSSHPKVCRVYCIPPLPNTWPLNKQNGMEGYHADLKKTTQQSPRPGGFLRINMALSSICLDTPAADAYSRRIDPVNGLPEEE
jgi:hypothetical protein